MRVTGPSESNPLYFHEVIASEWEWVVWCARRQRFEIRELGVCDVWKSGLRGVSKVRVDRAHSKIGIERVWVLVDLSRFQRSSD